MLLKPGFCALSSHDLHHKHMWPTEKTKTILKWNNCFFNSSSMMSTDAHGNWNCGWGFCQFDVFFDMVVPMRSQKIGTFLLDHGAWWACFFCGANSLRVVPEILRLLLWKVIWKRTMTAVHCQWLSMSKSEVAFGHSVGCGLMLSDAAVCVQQHWIQSASAAWNAAL